MFVTVDTTEACTHEGRLRRPDNLTATTPRREGAGGSLPSPR